MLHILSEVLKPLTALTHNLPSFVRDPIIAIVGQTCYTSLVWNIDLSDVHCLRLAISKVLGLGIVFGSSVLKVPQIFKILSAKSAYGVSLASYLLDTASLLIVVAYNMRLAFPFSTYGENLFLVIQNVFIIFLILLFSSRNRGFIAAFLVGTSLISVVLGSPLVPIPLLRVLLTLSIPLSLSSKIPQILINHREKSTGQLSAVLVFVSLAGCIARLFTTQTETGDTVMWWSFALTALFNAVIAVQMAMYWKATNAKNFKSSLDSPILLTNRKKSPGPASPSLGHTPPLSSPRKVSGMRYTRKVD